jgi:alpha-ketoglutarate-dependent taurine dioxygenase
MPPTATETTVRTRFEIRPVTASVGAELVGLDLAAALDDATVAEVEAALVRWKVVFIRGQRLDAEAQIAFARRLGPLTTGHPTVPSPAGLPLVFELDSLDGGRADHWHTDVTFTANPPAISVLRAVDLPDIGGDTMWADTEGAYGRLPEPLRHLAEELRVVHTNAYDYGQVHGRAEDEATARHRAVFRSEVFETEHPMVRIHPVSGRPGLLLGGFAQRIVGRPTSSASSRATSSPPSTSCGGGGRPVTWPSGTTGRPSTTPSTTTARSSAGCSG